MKKITLLILFLCATSSAFAASKEGLVKKGNALYKKGEFATSLENYQDALKAQPDSPAINFNLGTALYKAGKYEQSIGYLQKGLLGEDALLQKNAHFNLGNALYQQGESLSKAHIDQAIKALTESLRHFETVMNVDDKDTDAGYNHTIVQKELERLKKEKQQQEKQNQQNKDQKQQDKDKDQQQGSDKDPNNQDKKQDQGQEKNSSSNKSDQQKPSADSSQSNNQDGQKNQDQQKPQQGFSQNQDAADKSQPDDKQGSAQAVPGQMTKQEAKSLLKQFEQGQESAGLLNFGQHQSVERPVLKDW